MVQLPKGRAPALSGLTGLRLGLLLYLLSESLASTTLCSGVPVILNITVDPLPVPTATANTPFTGGDMNLIGGPGGMISYSWTGPNGFTSAVQNPVITGVTDAAAGIYTLTVTNAAGCSASTNVTVTINTVNLPTAIANTPCAGGNLTLIGGPSDMVSYSWTGPDGFTSSVQNPIITGVTAAAAGTYTLTVTNPTGGSASVTVNVIINHLPAPAIVGPNPVCQSADNSTEIYNTAAVPGSTYNWTVAGGTLSGQGTNQIAVRWTTPGPGSVSVTETVISTGCTATAIMNITVQPAPVTNGIFHN